MTEDPVPVERASLPENHAALGQQPGWTARHVHTMKVSLRIAFGIIWGIDGAMKFNPVLVASYPGMVANMAQGQPSWLAAWFAFWTSISATNAALVVQGTGVAELALAFALITGFLRKLAYLAGIPLSLTIWGVAEGFGGPYGPGSTDIGAAVMYVPALLLLILLSVTYGPSRFSLDALLEGRWPWWRKLAEFKGAGASSIDRRGEKDGRTPGTSHPALTISTPRPTLAVASSVVVLLLLIASGIGVSHWQGPTEMSNGVGLTEYVNATVKPGSGEGRDVFVPGNFSVMSNTTVVFTFTVEDTSANGVPSPMNMVAGSLDGTEEVTMAPGSATERVTEVPAGQITHTFTLVVNSTIYNAPLPAAVAPSVPVTVLFSIVLTQKGTYTWYCSAYNCGPKIPGNGMAGTIIVV